MAVATRAGSAVSSEKVRAPRPDGGRRGSRPGGRDRAGLAHEHRAPPEGPGRPARAQERPAQTVETLGKGAGLGSATRHMSSTTEDIRQVREELERANRQSPVEVLLNALTHRRGAHKHEN